MEVTIEFLKQLAINICEKIHPLLGTKEGGIKVSRGVGGDISMNIDLVAEELLIHSLEENKLDILLISEEIGEKYIGDKKKALLNEYVLIVDPIDGSYNATRGIPYCSISIAFAKGKTIKDIIKAVIIDLNSKDLYWAEKDSGAFLNDNPIQVSQLDVLDDCFFEINLPTKSLFKNIVDFRSIIKKNYKIRVLGSSALTLCQIAKGSMEVFINLRETNRLVDVAAGFLILKEAGGEIFSLTGSKIEGDLSVFFKFPFIASNNKLVSFLKTELCSNY
ncbi:MAG: inositol monophosphatase family protein [Promethearchaeota archaeon]